MRASVADAHALMGRMGAAFLALFVLVRSLGGPVGNLRGWPRGEHDEGAALEWFMLCKYPPDLAFASATLGVDLALIWALDRVQDPESKRWCAPLLAFGRTPLFFYVGRARRETPAWRRWVTDSPSAARDR